jgi:hypothetical protein
MLHIIKMPLAYRTVITCDVCERRIDDAGMAVALYREHGSAWHVHKGACHTKAESLAPSFREGFMELGEHLAQAVANSQPCIGDVDDDDESIELPAPAVLADRCIARAWDDSTDDESRLVLEQAAIALRRLMKRCVWLAATAEREEARRAEG